MKNSILKRSEIKYICCLLFILINISCSDKEIEIDQVEISFEKNKIIKINVNKLEKKNNYLITIFNQSVKDFKNEINIINNDLKKFKSMYINDKTVKKIESLLFCLLLG